MLTNRLLYAFFVVLRAGSPALAVVLSDTFLGSPEIWPFLWVGVASSLPASLLAARIVGVAGYQRYWSYLESFPGNTRGRIVMMWALVTAMTVLAALGSISSAL